VQLVEGKCWLKLKHIYKGLLTKAPSQAIAVLLEYKLCPDRDSIEDNIVGEAMGCNSSKGNVGQPGQPGQPRTPPPKLNILALHGYGDTSCTEMNDIIHHCGDLANFEIVHCPSRDPAFAFTKCWFSSLLLPDFGWGTAIQTVNNAASKFGTVDVLMGFSQGGQMAATAIHKGGYANVKGAIFIRAADMGYLPSMAGLVPTPAYTGLRGLGPNTKTIHFTGTFDPLTPAPIHGRRLASRFVNVHPAGEVHLVGPLHLPGEKLSEGHLKLVREMLVSLRSNDPFACARV